ncbi:unnamed protein product [Amoebophrya sp. A120]|nr:unnamed protein product [Amoebophrya sp. A120]|eukprot:GSA120T00009747001.1
MLVGISRSFNPLVLAEGEQYLADYSVSWRVNNSTTSTNGRLRIASMSIILDPDDCALDLIRIQFKHFLHDGNAVAAKKDEKISNNLGGVAPPPGSSASAMFNSSNPNNLQSRLLNVKANQWSLIRTHQWQQETRITTPFKTEQSAPTSTHYAIHLRYGDLNQLREVFEELKELNGNGSGGDSRNNAAATSGFTLSKQAQSNRDRALESLVLKLQSTSSSSSSSSSAQGNQNANQAGGRQQPPQQQLTVAFDLSRLQSHRERQNLQLREFLPQDDPRVKQGIFCFLIKPMVKHRGLLQLTDQALYFQPVPNFLDDSPVIRISLAEILHFFPRVCKLKDCGLEIVCEKKARNLFLMFEFQKLRNAVLQLLEKLLVGRSSGASGAENGTQSSRPSSNSTSRIMINPSSNLKQMLQHMLSLWQSGKLSNYHYLDFLNCAAGRSVNDLSQYPIFPWVLTDYQSLQIDLTDRKNFRDLSKPLGAMNPSRLRQFRERMREMPAGQKFLYGTHYSTPAYVLYFLVRELPECMLRLHSGSFDSWNRLFHSMETTYRATQDGSAVLMELLPEFFVLPTSNKDAQTTFLENYLNISTQEGDLRNVSLPPWSNGKPELFLSIQRAALESAIVTEMLPKWIDLIFGWKSRGENADNADNLFHPVCYLGPKSSGLAGSSSTGSGSTTSGSRNNKQAQNPEMNNQQQNLTNRATGMVSGAIGGSFSQMLGGMSGMRNALLGNTFFDMDDDVEHEKNKQKPNRNSSTNEQDAFGGTIDQQDKAVLEIQIEEFGRVPFQLFSEPHPPKMVTQQNSDGKNLWTVERLKQDWIQNEPWYVALAAIGKEGEFLHRGGPATASAGLQLPSGGAPRNDAGNTRIISNDVDPFAPNGGNRNRQDEDFFGTTTGTTNKTVNNQDYSSRSTASTAGRKGSLEKNQKGGSSATEPTIVNFLPKKRTGSTGENNLDPPHQPQLQNPYAKTATPKSSNTTAASMVNVSFSAPEPDFLKSNIKPNDDFFDNSSSSTKIDFNVGGATGPSAASTTINRNKAANNFYNNNPQNNKLPEFSSWRLQEVIANDPDGKLNTLKGEINQMQHTRDKIFAVCEDGCLRTLCRRTGVQRAFHLSNVPLKCLAVVDLGTVFAEFSHLQAASASSVANGAPASNGGAASTTMLTSRPEVDLSPLSAQNQQSTIIVVGGCDNAISLFDLRTGVVVDRLFTAHADTVTCMAHCVEQNLEAKKICLKIITGSLDQTVAVTEVLLSNTSNGMLNPGAVNPNTVNVKGIGLQLLSTFDEPDEPVSAVHTVIAGTSNFIACGTETGKVCLFTTDSTGVFGAAAGISKNEMYFERQLEYNQEIIHVEITVKGKLQQMNTNNSLILTALDKDGNLRQYDISEENQTELLRRHLISTSPDAGSGGYGIDHQQPPGMMMLGGGNNSKCVSMLAITTTTRMTSSTNSGPPGRGPGPSSMTTSTNSPMLLVISYGDGSVQLYDVAENAVRKVWSCGDGKAARLSSAIRANCDSYAGVMMVDGSCSTGLSCAGGMGAAATSLEDFVFCTEDGSLFLVGY